MSGLTVLSTRPLAVCAATDVLTAQRLDLDFYLPERVEAERQIAGGSFRSATLNSLRLRDRPITDGIRRHDKAEHGVHLIRTQNLAGPSVAFDGTAFISERWHRTSLKSEVQAGDLLLAIRGYLGAAAIVRNGAPRSNINQHIARIGVDQAKCSVAFLWAFFCSRIGRTVLERYVTGTVQRGVTLPDLRALRVPVPDRRIQDYIGAKVELAERCRASALKRWSDAYQRLARAVGCSLDPATFEVRSAASVSAAGYEVASIRPAVVRVAPNRLDRYIGAQFFHPRRAKALLVIEESGLKVQPLVSLATRCNERITSQEMQQQALLYIGLAQIDSTTGYISKNAEEEPTGTSARFRAGDILFSKLRPYLNKVSICPEHIVEAAGSTELVTYRANNGVDPYYLFFVLKSPLVLNQVIDITSGSTHPRVAPELIDEVSVPLASEADRKAIGASARSTLILIHRATSLVDAAKADVEALIEGTLDTKAILSGKLMPPTEEEVLGA